MITYKQFTVTIVLLVSIVVVTTAVSDETGKINPQLQKICDNIDHLKKDFRQYFNVYKKFTESFNTNNKLKGNNKCRDELNRMFNILKKLLDLIRRMELIKDQLVFGTGTNVVVQILDSWVLEILNMVADLADIASAIAKCDKSSTAEDLVPEFRRLNQDCLDPAQDSLILIMQAEVEAIGEQTDSAIDDRSVITAKSFIWASPVPSFWNKVSVLQGFCKQLIACFIGTRWSLVLYDLKGSTPYRELQRLCGCLVRFCRSVYQLMQIKMDSSRMTPEALEKALCEWLMGMMEIRVLLLEYYNDLLAAVMEITNTEGLGHLGSEVFFEIEECFGDLFLKLDECLLQLQCDYIDMMLAGGPRHFNLSLPVDNVDDKLENGK